MLKLKDIMKEYFDAEDVISTMADKNKKIEECMSADDNA